jgi:eukaryotic-like serine/threonine-protein kinase
MIQNKPAANNLRATVDEIVDRWRAGDPPNALSVFAKFPEVVEHHSLAVDLAYEEYCLREESGEELDPKQFCRQFSRLRHSLGRMLHLHGLMRSASLGLPADKATDWPAAGKQWLDWVLLEEIGRGAFSRVFVAEEPSLGHRRVVVKCSMSGPGEAFVLGKFAHPNVMPIHSIRSDEDRDLVGICMPLVGRVTFAQVLDRIANSDEEAVSPKVFSPEYGGWPETVPQTSIANRKQYALEVARQIEQVARGLAAAHELKVLHGDIKPSNILLSFAGEPMLVDFNLSVAEQGPLQRLGGTPPYMAPERLKLLTLQAVKTGSNEGAPDFRSDVFSLGVVLFELLYGEAPFELQLTDLTASYRRQTTETLLKRRDVAGLPVPPQLAAIVERAIALDPADRFPTAAALADRLADFASGVRAQQRRKVRRGVVAVLLALAIALLSFTLPILLRSKENWALRSAIKYIEHGDFALAAEQLQIVRKRAPDPGVAAWLGYCFARLENFPLAKVHFEQAQPERDDSGILWHNIGCCKLLDRQSRAAIEDFNRALELNPHLRQSYAQRAMAKTRLAMKEKTLPLPGTFDDLACALSLGEEEPSLMFDAAQIYAFGVKHKLALRSDAEHCIRRALQLGIAPQSFEGLTFKSFDLQQLTPRPLPAPAPARSKADDFLPPAHKLQAILERVP